MGRKKLVSAKRQTNILPIRMDATFFFERAVRSLDRLHYEKALKYFRRATELEPHNPVNHCNMAGILSEMGDYAESNRVLQNIVESIEPAMTECYFYMANNYANMDDFESAESALIYYLERDPEGQFIEEAEEMMELLGFELERPVKLRTIKSREGLFEHDKARSLLESGRFVDAVKLLEKIVKKHPDLLAARNNLALAYYYLGEFELTHQAIREVLRIDPGNLHALCNLAIFYQHFDRKEELAAIVDGLKRTYPFHLDQVFKIATTMGILEEHEQAYVHFRRLLRSGDEALESCLYHYAAVAAYNSGRKAEARRLWSKAAKLYPDSDIPKFYLSVLDTVLAYETDLPYHFLNYHYHLPFEEHIRMTDRHAEQFGEPMKLSPLIRSSFLWALEHGDYDTKLQVLQALGKVKDQEVQQALKRFLLAADEDDYLKKIAVFVLRSMGLDKPIDAVIGGKRERIDPHEPTSRLPKWEEKWQSVMEIALAQMGQRYDLIQQHDLQTLWVEFLTRSYPEVPTVVKVETWAAALEYLTAKMHRREISYQEVSLRYGVSVQTVSKHVRTIDRVCGLKEKMDAIFSHYHGKF